jgi:hypothetical protein
MAKYKVSRLFPKPSHRFAWHGIWEAHAHFYFMNPISLAQYQNAYNAASNFV